MIITTAGRTNEEMIQLAKTVANELKLSFIQRNKKSIQALHSLHQEDVLVIGKNRFEWFPFGAGESKEPVFFHPNTAMFRAKRWLAGEIEPFLQATSLQNGMSFLDCTLGLASDSIMASLAVGPGGKVVGIEATRLLAFLVKTGLRTWEVQNKEMMEAMKRVEVLEGNYRNILPGIPSNSFDVVYFDPMFEKQIEESNGIRSLKTVAVYDDLHQFSIDQALRVAKHRVVFKDHWQSKRFERFGFTVQKRKTAKFHYGYLQKNDSHWTF